MGKHPNLFISTVSVFSTYTFFAEYLKPLLSVEMSRFSVHWPSSWLLISNTGNFSGAFKKSSFYGGRMNRFTYLNLWAGKKLTLLKRRRAGRGWWRSQWSREAGAAWGSGRWCPGKGCQGSRRSKPSASSHGNPSSPTPHSPWSYSDLDDHSPGSKTPKQILNTKSKLGRFGSRTGFQITRALCGFFCE